VKILDLKGRIVYLNPAGAKMLGVSLDDVKDRPWTDLWEGRHQEAAAAALHRAKSGERATFEGFCKNAGGPARWWDVSMMPIADADGRPAQLLAVSRDITERRREADFREGQHEVLEMIATGFPLQKVLASLVTLIERRTDDMLCSVLLLSEDGRHLRHGAAPSLPEAYIKAIDGAPIGPRAGSCGTAMYLGRPVIVTDVLTDPVWADYRHLAREFGFRACWSTPIFSARYEVLGSFAMYYRDVRAPAGDELQLIQVAVDISKLAIEHQRAHEARHRSEERTRAILRAIPDWMFILNAEGTFLDYHVQNPEELLIPPEAFLGRRVADVLPREISDPLTKALKNAREVDELQIFEYSLETGASQRFYEVAVVRCDDDTFLNIVRDISDRKRAELNIAAQQRQLAHLNRVATMGELSGAIAHELSQPLTAILTNAQAARRLIAQDQPDLPEVRAALEDIVFNDKRAGVVIERLRALLKKDSSSFEPLDLNVVAREVLDLARSDLVARRVTVTTRLDPALGPVGGDRIQIQQVLLNLLLNAAEAMNTTALGDRQLLVMTRPKEGFAELSVSDRGVGIPEDRLDAIFEPFVTFRDQGLGLGLAISRSIIVAHGGRITAENNPDGGSTFRCFLPISVMPQSPATPA
jgi:PAS domain S-box-containing protein